jgi:hypothetical protein
MYGITGFAPAALHTIASTTAESAGRILLDQQKTPEKLVEEANNGIAVGSAFVGLGVFITAGIVYRCVKRRPTQNAEPAAAQQNPAAPPAHQAPVQLNLARLSGRQQPAAQPANMV